MSINLSNKESVILRLLIDNPELYGWDMVALSDGALKKSGIYTMLSRLEAKGFIETSRIEERLLGGKTMPRRYYRINGLGRRVIEIKEMSSGGLMGMGACDV